MLDDNELLVILLAGVLSAQFPDSTTAQTGSTTEGSEEVLGEMSAEQVGEHASELLTSIQAAVEQIEIYRVALQCLKYLA